MACEDLTAIPATELAVLCRGGQVSPVETVEAVLARIEATGDPCQAFITVAADHARAAARVLAAADNQLPLYGVPVTVKDLTATAGIRTTRGALAGPRAVPARSAVAVQRLQQAGAIIVGKTTTCDGGWKAEAGNLLVGPARNPWNPALTAGGSSGGAGVAVACGYGPIATGTDGAGSIRIPASFCGVVGYKPSFGLVPYSPVSAEGLSHFGPLTRTVADAALAVDVLAGSDERDPTSWGRTWAQRGGPWLSAALQHEPGALRIAMIDSVDDYPVDAEVKEALGAAAALLAGLGHRVEPIAWRGGSSGMATAYRPLSVILGACAAADLRARDAGLPVDAGLAAVAAWGATLSAADVAQAMAARVAFTEHVRQSMEGYDLALLPTSAALPFRAGADTPEAADTPAATDPERWLAWCCFCYVGNLTGYPAISLPLAVSSGRGRAGAGLPIGIQLMGRWRQDATVLRVARQLEVAAPWAGRLRQLHERIPPGNDG
ncbi:MAG: Amidase [Actinomycetia bacterium]|nr:Amidase [Actinomycetes bacterium]